MTIARPLPTLLAVALLGIAPLAAAPEETAAAATSEPSGARAGAEPEPDGNGSGEAGAGSGETAPRDEHFEAEDVVAGDERTILEPLFPGITGRTGVRVQLRTEVEPAADVDSGHVSLYRPEIRVRGTVPFSERVAVRLTARYGTGIYEFSGDTDFGTLGDPLDVQRAFLTAEGALRIDDEDRALLVADEAWSVLGGVFAGSAWEDDVFDRGIEAGGVLALGYELPDRLRLAAGLRLSNDLEDGGLDVGPAISLRWSPTERVTLHSRSLGLELEYRWSRDLELSVAAFRRSRSYRLENRLDAREIVLRDREVRTGVGLEWRFSPNLRLHLETGAVVWRKLRARADDLPPGGAFAALDLDERVGPSAYVDLRLEVRP